MIEQSVRLRNLASARHVNAGRLNNLRLHLLTDQLGVRARENVERSGIIGERSDMIRQRDDAVTQQRPNNQNLDAISFRPKSPSLSTKEIFANGWLT